MDNETFERLVSELFEKYAQKDAEGYSAWIGEKAFGDAIAEVVDRLAGSGPHQMPPTEDEVACNDLENQGYRRPPLNPRLRKQEG